MFWVTLEEHFLYVVGLYRALQARKLSNFWLNRVQIVHYRGLRLTYIAAFSLGRRGLPICPTGRFFFCHETTSSAAPPVGVGGWGGAGARLPQPPTFSNKPL